MIDIYWGMHIQNATRHIVSGLHQVMSVADDIFASRSIVNIPFRKFVALYYNSRTENSSLVGLPPYHSNGAVVRCWIFQEHERGTDPSGRAV